MRRILLTAAIVGAVLGAPRSALAQNGGQIQGFGGLTFRGLTTGTTFGGSVAVPLGPNAQVAVQGGRMSDVSWPLTAFLDLTPVDLRARAYYGEAALRITGDRRSAVRPYAEVSGGFARLQTDFIGLGDRTNLAVNTALNLLNRTSPMLGVGGGVMMQGGPVLVDLGYRYHRIMTGRSVQSVLTGGDINVHQFQLGLGFRF
jgi:outer membrane protein with beta-barrel domain